MNKKFELGHEDTKLEPDINELKTKEPPTALVSKLEPKSKKESRPDNESGGTKSKTEKPLIKSEAKEYKNKMGLWNDMLEKYKEDMEKEKQAYEKATKKEKKLQSMQN